MATKKSAGRIKVLFAFLLLFGPAFLLILISTRGCEHRFKQLDDFGAAVNYQFTDARGKHYTAKDFEGDIVIITTIQETCPDSCSISFWHVDQMIYQHIRKNSRKKMKQVRLISFATDGLGKPIKNLAVIEQALRDQVEEYDPNVWIKKNHLRMVLSGKTEGMIRRMKEHIALLQKQYDKQNSVKGEDK